MFGVRKLKKDRILSEFKIFNISENGENSEFCVFDKINFTKLSGTTRRVNLAESDIDVETDDSDPVF